MPSTAGEVLALRMTKMAAKVILRIFIGCILHRGWKNGTRPEAQGAATQSRMRSC